MDLRIESERHVLHVEFQRPERRNAITIAMYQGLSDALERAADDPELRAVLLRGQADCFTAGNDLHDFLDPATRQTGAAPRFLRTIAAFPKPIVAAVGGPAVGIGTTMLLHCDLVIAAASARFQLPFVPLGLCPEAGASMLLPQMAGPRVAAELLLLGDFFDAARARKIGLVNRVVNDDALIDEAVALAERLTMLPMEAVRTTKAMLRQPWNRTVREAIEAELPHFERLLASPEARAAFRQFLESR